MSLRREEAELRRVLDLSTQQAKALAFLPPVQLSSAPTDDSRDFELRPLALHGSAAGTSGAAMSTPLRPELGRPHRFLSPDDDDDGDVWSPVQHSATHVASPLRQHQPMRYIRGDSPDPIDAFHVNDNNRTVEGNRSAEVLAGNGMPTTTAATSTATAITATTTTTTTTTGSSQTGGEAARKPSPHSNATSHPSLIVSSSSPAEGSGRRLSARVQSIQDKKEEQAAERKRKRAERKAREAAEKAAATGTPTTQSSVDPETEGAEDRREKKKAKTSGQERNVASKPTSQSSIDGQAVNSNGIHADPSPVNYSPKRASVTPQPEYPPPSSDGPADRPSPERQESPKIVSPRHARSPVKDQPSNGHSGVAAPGATASTPLPSRPPLQPAQSTPTNSSTPNGGRWRTPRNDLAGVLSRFPKAKVTGMSRRLKIVPLHANIGPGVKALPPPPPKAKKKVEDDDDEDDEDENGNPKIKVGSREWLMMED